MLAWLLTAQVLTAGPALHVDVSKDRTISCKANALLEKAVRLRLPRVRLASGKHGPEDLVASLHRVGGADWRFELRRADGSIAVSRELQAMACPQLADLSALILERYLSGIDWAGKDVPPAKVKPVPPPVETPPIPPQSSPSPSTGSGRASAAPQPEAEGPRPADVALPVPEPEPAPTRGPSTSLGELGGAASLTDVLDPPPVTHVTLSAGLGGWVSVPLEATASLAIGLGLRLAGRFHASLLFLTGNGSLKGVAVNNLPRGSLALQTHGGFGTFAVCTGRFVLCGGVLAGARVTTATAMGPPTGPRVFGSKSTTAALPAVGGYGRLTLPMYGRLGVAADLGIAIPLGANQFGIDGIPSSTVYTPAVDFLGSVALSLQMF